MNSRHFCICSLFDFLYRWIIFLIYPPYCACCKVFLPRRDVFCKSCFEHVKPIATIPLKVRSNLVVPVMAVCAYDGPVKRLILAKGYSDQIAARQLGQLMWERLSLAEFEYDVFVSIPLYWKRFARRGYNQTNEICLYLANKSGKKVINVLRKNRHTKFQSQCGAHERTDNVKGALEVKASCRSQIKGKHIVIVDDLMTTGSTLKEAVRHISKLKPASIRVMVACRVI